MKGIEHQAAETHPARGEKQEFNLLTLWAPVNSCPVSRPTAHGLVRHCIKTRRIFANSMLGGAGAYPSNRFTPGGRFVHAHVLPFEYGDP